MSWRGPEVWVPGLQGWVGIAAAGLAVLADKHGSLSAVWAALGTGFVVIAMVWVLYFRLVRRGMYVSRGRLRLVELWSTTLVNPAGCTVAVVPDESRKSAAVMLRTPDGRVRQLPCMRGRLEPATKLAVIDGTRRTSRWRRDKSAPELGLTPFVDDGEAVRAIVSEHIERAKR